MATTGVSLKGKVAIVTGASSGIGAETARYFASLGCYVSITGRNLDNLMKVAKECEERGLPKDKVLVVQGDLSCDEDVKKLVNQTVTQFGRIDVLVNNAGIVKPDTIETVTMDNFDSTFAVNTRAPLHLLILAGPHLVKTKGTVVNVSSVNGVRAFPGVLSYCMSKSALDALTLGAAETLALQGVRINSVNPGVIKTDVHRRGGMNDEQYAQFLEKCSRTHALGRIGQPIEVAKTIAFLASDDSSYTTGETVTIDGGRHAMVIMRPKPEDTKT
ncbi:3-oxoacyl-[acyl-carrier-protein] reductase FabG-like [Amphiura filiformis]|uniref:3-oxoacyl-[acyl-carrier-protein] reductase FabG-like n=1 Tax=Amphiura filiformis TaxID=82378 RepID=UPI003B20BE91